MSIYYRVQFDGGRKLATVAPTAAEHAVAKQAEWDCRKYIPKRSGRLAASAAVHGSQITWSAPYARLMYYGRIKVDPKLRVGGIPDGNGDYFSRNGVKKVRSDRKFQFASGGAFWFSAAKKAHIRSWERIAARSLMNGK